MTKPVIFAGLGKLIPYGRSWYAVPQTILSAHKTRPKDIPAPKALLRTKVEGRAWLKAYAGGLVWWDPRKYGVLGNGGQWVICDEAYCISCGLEYPISEGTYCLQCVKEGEE